MIFGTPNIAHDVYAGPGPGRYFGYWNMRCKPNTGDWTSSGKSDDSWDEVVGDNSDWQLISPDIPTVKEC